MGQGEQRGAKGNAMLEPLPFVTCQIPSLIVSDQQAFMLSETKLLRLFQGSVISE